LFPCRAIELLRPRLRVSCLSRIRGQDRERLRIVPKVDRERLLDVSQEQAGDDERDERHCDLRDDERAA